jgi:GT2 family glycosyltransferase
MLKGSVAAVVVTHNRLPLLQQVMTALSNQTHKIDKIFVINNDSTDGTFEWLCNLTQTNPDVMHIAQSNVGGAGGFWRGTVEAYNTGYEWIWEMDDDVVPAADCLERLMECATPDLVCVPLRIATEGDVYYGHDIIHFNMSNPFHSIWKDVFEAKDLVGDLTYIDGTTLEGPLFHRTMLERAGCVDAKFFIYADDTEYSIRLGKAGIKKAIVAKAKLQRMLPPADEHNFDWKTYYLIRNLITIDRRHGKFFVKHLRPFAYAAVWLTRCSRWADVKIVFKALRDGRRANLG